MLFVEKVLHMRYSIFGRFLEVKGVTSDKGRKRNNALFYLDGGECAGSKKNCFTY